MHEIDATSVWVALVILGCVLECGAVRAWVTYHEAPATGTELRTFCITVALLGAALCAALAIFVDAHGMRQSRPSAGWTEYLLISVPVLGVVAAVLASISVWIFSPAARQHWRAARAANTAEARLREYRRLDTLARKRFKIAKGSPAAWWQVGTILEEEEEEEEDARRRRQDDWLNRDDPVRGTWDPSSAYYDHSSH